jgi:hypothetical protein
MSPGRVNWFRGRGCISESWIGGSLIGSEIG